jgi:hypothetical protein
MVLDALEDRRDVIGIGPQTAQRILDMLRSCNPQRATGSRPGAFIGAAYLALLSNASIRPKRARPV